RFADVRQFSLHRVQVTAPSAAHVAEPGGFAAVHERTWREASRAAVFCQRVHDSGGQAAVTCTMRKSSSLLASGARTAQWAGDAGTVSGTSLAHALSAGCRNRAMRSDNMNRWLSVGHRLHKEGGREGRRGD